MPSLIRPVPDSLSITIDGPQLREAPERLEAGGDFVVCVDNLGRATHVHFALDGELGEAAAIAEPNQFVDSGERLRVTIPVDVEIRPLEGTLTVATGYGADEARIPVVIEGDSPTPTPTPERREQPDDRIEGLRSTLLSAIGRETLAFAAIAISAVLLAALAVVLTDSTVVLFGALFVIGAVTVGSCYLLFI